MTAQVHTYIAKSAVHHALIQDLKQKKKNPLIFTDWRRDSGQLQKI
jgi:hypothetical protein